MAQMQASAAQALTWNAADSNLERFNKPSQTLEATTYGFKGFPENNMFRPKRPLRHQPSADVNTDVNRYFRKDSATEWKPPAIQQRMPSPPPREPEQKEADWLQTKRSSSPPPPQPAELHQTISPRYADEAQSYRKPPVIRDPLRELTSSQRRKKIEEHYQAEEDLAMARQRREKEKYEKIEEQQRIRELQDSYRPWGRPGGGAPNRVRDMQNSFDPYGLPGGGAPTVKELLADGYEPYGRPGGGAPLGDTRKQKFTEHQLLKQPEAKYEMPQGRCDCDDDRFSNQDFAEMRYGDENRGMDRVRTSMEQRTDRPEKGDFGRATTMPLRSSYSDSFGPRHARDVLRQQEHEIDELRRNLNQLEREQRYDSPSWEPRYDKRAGRNDTFNGRKQIAEQLHDHSQQLRMMQDEIEKNGPYRLKEEDGPAGLDESHRGEPHLLRPAGLPTRALFDTRLKAQDDMSYRAGDRSDRPPFDAHPRAQSGQRDYDEFEPQTERGYKRYNRDRDIFGQSVETVPDYLNVSPRRHPVGQLYNKESTYDIDYNPPFERHGRRRLGNPNQEPYEPFSPFGMEGGGAPRTDPAGQRNTRIAGCMNVLGREMSNSARARRAHKRELLHQIREQATFERARKEADKAYARQGFVEVAATMRNQKVGYPKVRPDGLMDNNHLPQMFEYDPYRLPEQRKYHDFLSKQVEDRQRNIRLGQLEEKRQAREHFRTQDAYYGRRGGGNYKGENLRKVNLDKAIHNPQSTTTLY